MPRLELGLFRVSRVLNSKYCPAPRAPRLRETLPPGLSAVQRVVKLTALRLDVSRDRALGEAVREAAEPR